MLAPILATSASRIGHNQPRHCPRDTRAEVKASLVPRGAAHLRFARCASLTCSQEVPRLRRQTCPDSRPSSSRGV